MSVLDIDERIEQADKQADLYLRWKVEDDEFQKKYPDSHIYSWFAEHSKTWKPEPAVGTYLEIEKSEITTLEQEYGKPHLKFGPGNPVFMIQFFCPAENLVDIVNPGAPPDMCKAYTLGKITAYSRMIQLERANVTISSPDGTSVNFVLRLPPIIALKNVTEWPDWLIDSRKYRCRQPWDQVTFWVDNSCNTTPINNLIYQPGISSGDPTGYNFFRPSDYFLRF